MAFTGSKPFSANIPVSETLKIKNEIKKMLTGNVANSRKFKLNFLNYSIASRLCRMPDFGVFSKHQERSLRYS